MSYEIVRGPFMLYETVAMLYKYVNNISFQSILSRQRLLRGAPATKALVRRMDRLQEIMEEVCAGLDPEDPILQRYFACVGVVDDDLCLANLMTASFCTLNEPELRAHGAEICATWKKYQQDGLWIQPDVTGVLSFWNDPDRPEDLFEQVSCLNLPAEFRLQLYGALRKFEKSMEELIELTAPLSDRLEALYRQDTWLLDETVAYWEEKFKETPPFELLATIGGVNYVRNAREHTRVAFGLMSCNILLCGRAASAQDSNLLYIGCGTTISSMSRKQSDDLENAGAILRALGDKKRLEILRRLSKGRLYSHELADVMQMDPGNMSRILAVLHNYGFLRQERESLRNYYQTDRETIHRFLQLVETVIFE